MKKLNLLLLMSLIFGALIFNSCDDDTEEEIPGAPTVTAPSSITVAAGESVDISFSVTIPGGYASAEASAQGGSATISDEPAEGATSGTVVVSFTAGSTAGAASVALTVTDQNEKSGNATANLSIEAEIPDAPTVTAPSSNITVAAGESVDISFSVTIPGGYASAEASAQGGSATISDEPAEGETSGTVVVSFTAGSTAGAASVTLTVADQNEKSGNATANLSIEEEATVTDIDGNVYTTVVIGDQEWFAENLKTTKYNDGTAIPRVYTNSDWNSLTTGAYAVYPDSLIDGLNSDEEILDAYGALYNWYSVETGKLCPEGWHVATDEEWTVLTDYVGGTSVASGKLKSKRTEPDAHPRWKSPNTGATNEYGFSALPGGRRSRDGGFYNMGDFGRWWTSTALDATNAIDRNMYFDVVNVHRSNYNKGGGFSVRCVRD